MKTLDQFLAVMLVTKSIACLVHPADGCHTRGKVCEQLGGLWALQDAVGGGHGGRGEIREVTGCSGALRAPGTLQGSGRATLRGLLVQLDESSVSPGRSLTTQATFFSSPHESNRPKRGSGRGGLGIALTESHRLRGRWRKGVER